MRLQSRNQVEFIAHSPDDEPATEILNTQVTLTDSMLSHISQAYIEEISPPPLPVNKCWPKWVIFAADRGGYWQCTGHLLAGEDHYATQYQAVWGWAKGQLDQLNANRDALSQTQQTQIDALTEAANTVTPLFSQLIEIDLATIGINRAPC